MTAIGVAAGAGAAQLGFGYGLGVITWTPTEAGANDTAWADGLAWATWLAASSTVLGAVCAQRLHKRSVPPAVDRPAVDAEPTSPAPAPGAALPQPAAALDDGRPARAEGTDAATDRPAPVADTLPDERGGLFHRLSLALGAGLGGLVTVLLVAVPARVAAGADTGTPQRVAALHAALGILIGVFVALWALRSRTAALNVTATAAWLWLLAVVSVIDGVRVGRGLTGAQLGAWQLDPDHARYWIGGQLYWPGALLALVPALLIGALVARGAARSGGHRIGAAASGAAGPLLVALAYLTTVPRWATLGPAQFSTQIIAPYAVIAGVGGSILAAVLAERAGRRRAAHRRSAAAGTQPVPTAPIEPDPTTRPSARIDPASTDATVPTSADRADGANTDARADSAGTDGAGTTTDTSTGTTPRRGRTATASAATRTASRSGDATAAPRVPAPRPAPDDAAPAEPATTGATEDPAPRRARPPRRSTRPTD
ncbi:Conserved hypothetical protein [Micromonospora lupini str. Lupac 08]|uniref:Uncharacterized protein n=1 Tax=Micromonospora lupini str. Lupac 08 TaxID=1150864 RepID=I0LEC4_9ACTN|nr:hypothetical protein [Micromonospora lupini]CCH22171.1 Conserved hypothetical protein [Micromonospora lupini str. Lupac 08]